MYKKKRLNKEFVNVKERMKTGKKNENIWKE